MTFCVERPPLPGRCRSPGDRHVSGASQRARALRRGDQLGTDDSESLIYKERGDRTRTGDVQRGNQPGRQDQRRLQHDTPTGHVQPTMSRERSIRSRKTELVDHRSVLQHVRSSSPWVQNGGRAPSPCGDLPTAVTPGGEPHVAQSRSRFHRIRDDDLRQHAATRSNSCIFETRSGTPDGTKPFPSAPGAPAPVGFGMLNLSMLIEHQARVHPDREAIVCGAVRLTYAQLDRAACRVAAALAARGVQPGDHVAISCPNTSHFPIAYFGILKVGAAVVPLNVLLKPREIAQHLRDSAASAYLCFEGTVELPMAQMGYAAFSEVDSCEHFLVMTQEWEATSPVPDTLTLDALTRAAPAAFETVMRAPDDTAVILYTSGTTGVPKGAELTHANMLLNAQASRDLGLELLGVAQATALCVLPLFHSFGQTAVMNAHLLQGNRVVLLPRFEPASVLATMVAERVSAFAGVPTMYWALLRHVEEQGIDTAPIAANLRVCTSGGAALAVEVLHAFDARFGVEILEGYGLSETSPVATFNQSGRPRKPGSVGLPIWGCDVKVVGTNDAEMPRGELGEVVIRGHNVMKGYFRRPEATAEALRGGWFHSGDVARMDEDGYLFIADRLKDMIIRCGLNVYPREIEEVLMTHPAVSLAAVIGVPHSAHGEEVMAFVIRKAGATLGEDELIAWTRDTMAAYKYPRTVEFVDALPTTATGKVLKRELHATHTAG